MATMVFVVRRLRAIDCRLRWRVASRITKAMPTGGEISARVAEPTARRDWSPSRPQQVVGQTHTFRFPTLFPRSLSILLLPCRPALSPSARPASLELPHHPHVRLLDRRRRRGRRVHRPGPVDIPARLAAPPKDPGRRRRPTCPGISPGARVPATSDMNSACAAPGSPSPHSPCSPPVPPPVAVRLPAPTFRVRRLCRRLRGNVPRVPRVHPRPHVVRKTVPLVVSLRYDRRRRAFARRPPRVAEDRGSVQRGEFSELSPLVRVPLGVHRRE